MRNFYKNQNGITIVILLVTIAVIAILVGVTVTHLDTGTDIRNYNYMVADVQLLRDKILIYYNNTGTIPITGNAFNAGETLGTQASNRDNNDYYLIDLNQLNNITLNYGGGTLENGDVYIINERSHEVYYLKGVVYEGETYYKPGIEV